MRLDIYNILFLDVETVPRYGDYSQVPEMERELWEGKTAGARAAAGDVSGEDYYPRAGIFAEFGKIVCISVGFFRYAEGRNFFRVKSFYGDDEKVILEGFCELVEGHFSKEVSRMCAHNGKEFDFPYICRRLIINKMRVPKVMDVRGRKPWEIQHLDTLEMWKFGDYKNYTSLKLLTYILGLPSPKEDIDGSEVAGVYYKERDLRRIAEYCQRDVVALARVYLRLLGEEGVDDEDVVVVQA